MVGDVIACLVACPSCHAQFDPSGVPGDSFRCHCGARVPTARPEAVDAPVRRCSACGAAADPGAEKCGYCGSVLAAGVGRLVCPECFARNSGQARFCSSCGVEFRPQPIVAESAPVACPVCTVDLAPRSLAGLAIHECDGCRGLWVPAASFDALVAHARTREHAQASDGLGPETPAHPRPATAVTYRKCPVCRQVMNRKNFGRISGVIVDWCRADGTWLDASELEAIGAFVAGGGLERAADIDKEDERVAASMRAFDRIAQTPPVSDGNPVTLARVLATIFTK